MFQKFLKSFKGLAYGEFFKEVSPITEINIFVQIQANFFLDNKLNAKYRGLTWRPVLEK